MAVYKKMKDLFWRDICFWLGIQLILNKLNAVLVL